MIGDNPIYGQGNCIECNRTVLTSELFRNEGLCTVCSLNKINKKIIKHLHKNKKNKIGFIKEGK